jgi:polyisoprenoid-binding protein YceI
MEKLIIDRTHSEIGFKIKHLMISTVRGNFSEFEGSAEKENDKYSVEFSLKTSSVNTNNTDRDKHLVGPDFFDSEKYPTIDFMSRYFDFNSPTINGYISIKGITKPISLNVVYNGANVDPWGNTKHGFEISGKISRKDFDLNWNSPLSTGGLLLDDEVNLNLDIQMTELVEQLESA